MMCSAVLTRVAHNYPVEIRNCVFQGRSTRLLKEIADSRDFKVSIGNGIRDLRMKDREAVLRCLSFVVLNYELDYDGSMDKFLEKAMSRINKMSDDETDMLKMHALNVYSLTYRLFGDGNFRYPQTALRTNQHRCDGKFIPLFLLETE